MTVLQPKALAIATVVCGLIGFSAWRAQAVSPASQVNVGWTAAPSKPTGVRFEGGPDFRETPSSWVGSKTLAGRFASHSIVISFGTAEFPLQLVMRAGQPPASFAVTKAHTENCALDVVNAINSAQPATDNERIAVMFRARALISGNTCDRFQNRKLARRYFEMSCRLAESENASFEVSRDARDTFLRFAMNQTDQAYGQQCKGVAQQKLISRLFAVANEAKVAGDSATLQAAVDELAAHVDDANWADGVAGYGLTKTRINVLLVDDLYDRQRQAYAERNLEQALSMNDRLSALSKDDEYRESFRAVKVSESRLSEDRAAIMNARSASD